MANSDSHVDADTKPIASGKAGLKHISDELMEGLIARLEQLKEMSANPSAVESNIAAVKEKMKLRAHASAVGRTIIKRDVLQAQRAISRMAVGTGGGRILEQFRGMTVDDVPQRVLEGKVPPSNAAEAKAASAYQEKQEREKEGASSPAGSPPKEDEYREPTPEEWGERVTRARKSGMSTGALFYTYTRERDDEVRAALGEPALPPEKPKIGKQQGVGKRRARVKTSHYNVRELAAMADSEAKRQG